MPHELKPDEQTLCKRIEKYIDEHLSEKITDSVLVKKCKATNYFLENRFPLGFRNKTTAQVLKEKRVRKSIEVLLDNKILNLNTVALRVGFSRRDTLSRAFKDHYGMNISEYIRYIKEI